ncbi:DUF4886 domain-containing protein [Candidatus Lokiarchaeum ossiferum]|uniref:DUF4886 domain-containing protein n=1 Tax=Candidatus Lokiarchaeum ossiferum TaxID=2951803 RepID=UPI00352D7DB6
MLSRKKIVIFFFIQFILLAPTINTASSQENEPIKILFIGSSYFAYNNLPRLFDNFAKEAGKNVSISTIDPLGTYLYDHAFSESTATKIKEKKWNIVILQGIGALTAYPQNYTNKPVDEALSILREKILLNNPSTRIIFCLPWAFEDGMTWKAGWDDNYEEMQLKINSQTIKLSGKIGFTTAPVGVAWNTAINEKNYPLHYLHLSDWNHPSLNGTYLMNCVIYSSIFQENCTGNSFHDELEEEDAMYLQDVASRTVLENLSLMNLNGSISEIKGNWNQINDSTAAKSINGINFFNIMILASSSSSIIILQSRRKLKLLKKLEEKIQ